MNQKINEIILRISGLENELFSNYTHEEIKEAIEKFDTENSLCITEIYNYITDEIEEW